MTPETAPEAATQSEKVGVNLIPPSGKPENKTYSVHVIVDHVIRDALPPGLKDQAAQYQCADGTRVLNPTDTLEQAKVKFYGNVVDRKLQTSTKFSLSPDSFVQFGRGRSPRLWPPF